MLYLFWVVDSLRTLKVHHCLSLVTIGCIATIDLVGDNRNLKFQAYFEVVYPSWVIDKSWNFKGPSLFVLGYYWLPLANIDLVGDNSDNVTVVAYTTY